MVSKKAVFYKLFHKRKNGHDKEGNVVHSTIQIGIYSTKQAAKKLIPQYKKLNGFKNFPHDFFIEQLILDYDIYSQEAVNCSAVSKKEVNVVYELSHEYEIYEGKQIYDCITYFGIFSNQETANRLLKKYSKLKPFSEHPDGFLVDKCFINKSYWVDGFFIVD